jgi:hypothetical protein
VGPRQSPARCPGGEAPWNIEDFIDFKTYLPKTDFYYISVIMDEVKQIFGLNHNFSL